MTALAINAATLTEVGKLAGHGRGTARRRRLGMSHKERVAKVDTKLLGREVFRTTTRREREGRKSVRHAGPALGVRSFSRGCGISTFASDLLSARTPLQRRGLCSKRSEQRKTCADEPGESQRAPAGMCGQVQQLTSNSPFPSKTSCTERGHASPLTPTKMAPRIPQMTSAGSTTRRNARTAAKTMLSPPSAARLCSSTMSCSRPTSSSYTRSSRSLSEHFCRRAGR